MLKEVKLYTGFWMRLSLLALLKLYINLDLELLRGWLHICWGVDKTWDMGLRSYKFFNFLFFMNASFQLSKSHAYYYCFILIKSFILVFVLLLSCLDHLVFQQDEKILFLNMLVYLLTMFIIIIFLLFKDEWTYKSKNKLNKKPI